MRFFKNGGHLVSAYENYNKELVYDHNKEIDLRITRLQLNNQKKYISQDVAGDVSNLTET